MQSTHPFTAVEDQLLLALRDQGHYKWSFIKSHYKDRTAWSLRQRHRILHEGLRRIPPRGRRKLGHLTFRQRWKPASHFGPWTQKDDYELQVLHFKAHDWLHIAYAFPPHNAPDCLARWLHINPQARYPYQTEMDPHWMLKATNNREQTKCRKYWFSTRWRVFKYWFPNGRTFRDRREWREMKMKGMGREERLRRRKRKRIQRLVARERERVRVRDVLDAGEARWMLELAEEKQFGGWHACERQLLRRP